MDECVKRAEAGILTIADDSASYLTPVFRTRIQSVEITNSLRSREWVTVVADAWCCHAEVE